MTAGDADLPRQLLTLAADDLAAIEALFDAAAVTDAIVGFHAQQAAEKALKAALAAQGRDFPFTHNLTTLLQLCEDVGLRVPDALAEVDVLTPYAAAGRYGAESWETVDRTTARQLAAGAVAWARSVVEA